MHDVDLDLLDSVNLKRSTYGAPYEQKRTRFTSCDKTEHFTLLFGEIKDNRYTKSITIA